MSSLFALDKRKQREGGGGGESDGVKGLSSEDELFAASPGKQRWSTPLYYGA